LRILTVEYSHYPIGNHPAPLEEISAAYEYLTMELNIPPKKIILGLLLLYVSFCSSSCCYYFIWFYTTRAKVEEQAVNLTTSLIKEGNLLEELFPLQFAI